MWRERGGSGFALRAGTLEGFLCLPQLQMRTE